MHAGSFRVSVIHQTLTWTTVQDLYRSYVIILVRAYTHTGGLGTQTASQHNIFYVEKLTNFSCAPDGIQNLGPLDLESDTLYQFSHTPSPLFDGHRDILLGVCLGQDAQVVAVITWKSFERVAHVLHLLWCYARVTLSLASVAWVHTAGCLKERVILTG